MFFLVMVYRCRLFQGIYQLNMVTHVPHLCVFVLFPQIALWFFTETVIEIRLLPLNVVDEPSREKAN